MGHHNCLKIIILQSKAKEVQGPADKLIALGGVRDGSLAMSSTGQDLH